VINPLRRSPCGRAGEAGTGAAPLTAALAYWMLQQRIVVSQGESPILKKAIGNGWKGKLSPVLYILAIILAFLSPWMAVALYVFVALMRVVPDRHGIWQSRRALVLHTARG